jgi:hypothetical protein
MESSGKKGGAVIRRPAEEEGFLFCLFVLDGLCAATAPCGYGYGFCGQRTKNPSAQTMS